MRKIILYPVICFLFLAINPDTYGVNSRAYIRVSEEAKQMFQDAEVLGKKGDWAGTAKLCQQLLEKYSASLINASEEGTYNGVKYACYKLLASLPPAGKKAYRDIVDPVARPLMEMSQINNDAKILKDIVDRYFYSSYGAYALNLLAVNQMERGDLSGAAQLLEELLNLVASSEIPDISFSHAIANCVSCYSGMGRKEGLEKLSKRIDAKILNQKIMVNGKEVSLKDYIKSAQQSIGNIDSATALNWLTYGGNNSHDLIMQSDINSMPLCVWSQQIPATQKPLRSTNPMMPAMMMRSASYLPYFPSLFGDNIYLKTDTGVYAYNIKNQKEGKVELAWKFDQTFAGEMLYEERMLSPVTVTEDKVFANLITSSISGDRREVMMGWSIDVKYPLPKRALFAFDRLSGKILWSVGGQVKEREFLKKASFTMPPVVDNNLLYVAVVYAENDTDLPQHYICTFNAATGELYWKTFITSGLLEINLFNNPAREIIGSALTLDNDTVYYCSNIGVITAVDKFSGTIKWVKKYQQFEVPPTRNEYPAHLPLLWVNNPLLKIDYGADKSVLLVTPVDSSFLYALNPETGEEKWKWDGVDLGGVRYILGTKGEFLYLQGANNSICLNVAKEGKRVWVYPGPFRGKGGLAENAVYFSHPDKLAMVHPTSGKILNIWNWANLQTHPGNILIQGDRMITTSKDTINLFVK